MKNTFHNLRTALIMFCLFLGTTGFAQNATASISDGGAITLDSKSATSEVFVVDLTAYSNFLTDAEGVKKLKDLFERNHIEISIDRDKKQMTIRLQNQKSATEAWSISDWNHYLRSRGK